MRLHGFSGSVDISGPLDRCFTAQPPPDDGRPSFNDGAAAALHILLDGRLDNRDELARLLDVGDTGTDGAFVRAAYRRWGAGGISRLIGDFALALWDGTERRLLLASDPSGLKPLYYTQRERRVGFATVLSGLFTAPGVPRVLNERAFVDLLALNHDTEATTLWRGVSRVRAGTSVLIGMDRTTVDRWWSPLNARAVRYQRDDDYVQAAREQFERAVAVRLRGATPIVSLVSGGLDSSGLAATAARLSTAPVHALTAVPALDASLTDAPGRYADERPLVQHLARQHDSIALELVPCSGVDPIERDATPLFEAAHCAVAQSVSLGWFTPLLRRAAALGATTLLTGDMGNAVFSNDGAFRLRELFVHGRWLTLWRELDAADARAHRSAASLFRTEVLATFEPAWLHAWRARVTNRGLFGRWQVVTPIRPEVAAAHDLPARLVRNGFPGGEIGQHHGVAPLVDWLFERRGFLNDWTTALRAVHGLEVRDPYSDRRLIEFCAGLPSQQFLHRGQDRRLARRAFADRLAPEIADNPRKGMQNPDWFDRLCLRRMDLPGDLDRLAASPAGRHVFDLPRLRALVNNWPQTLAEAAKRGHEYRGMLPRAIHAAQFLCWAERPVTAGASIADGAAAGAAS